MENLLTETNEEIRLGERIKKITNKIEKGDNNIIKIISFISKIKESIQTMIETSSKPLKNIKFNFQEEKKTLNFDEYEIIEGVISKINSIILGESKREDEFLKLLFEWTGSKNMELLYRGTRDGMSSKNFHDKCDNQGKTIIIIILIISVIVVKFWIFFNIVFLNRIIMLGELYISVEL